jgi:ribosomal protein S18 acetylase RimI-like enzyme
MEVIIRQCDFADLDDLLDIAARTFADTFRAMNTAENFDTYMRQAFTREKFSAELANPHSTFYFISADGRLAGYMKLNVADAQNDLQGPESLEIERIYVKKGFQGRGLGRKLLEHALIIARLSGKKFAWLGVWEKNKSAIGFYQSQGFRQAGSHGFIIGEDHQTDLIMKIILSET